MDVVIAGSGALGRVLCDFLVLSGHNVLGFLEDDRKKIGKKVSGLPVYGFDEIEGLKDLKCYFVIGITDGKDRENVCKRLISYKCRFLDYRMENLFISPFASIGEGCTLLMHSCVMNNVVLGDFCHVHMFTIIGHDAVVGDYCSFTPHCVIGGGSRIGKGVSFGMGANVIPNITIGDYSIVGAGAVVTRDVPANSIIFGSPGQIRKRRR